MPKLQHLIRVNLETRGLFQRRSSWKTIERGLSPNNSVARSQEETSTKIWLVNLTRIRKWQPPSTLKRNFDAPSRPLWFKCFYSIGNTPKLHPIHIDWNRPVLIPAGSVNSVRLLDSATGWTVIESQTVTDMPLTYVMSTVTSISPTITAEDVLFTIILSLFHSFVNRKYIFEFGSPHTCCISYAHDARIEITGTDFQERGDTRCRWGVVNEPMKVRFTDLISYTRWAQASSNTSDSVPPRVKISGWSALTPQR